MLLHILAVSSPQLGELAILNDILKGLVNGGVLLVQRVAVAAVFFIVASWIIRWVRRGVDHFLVRRNIDPTVKSFLDSVTNITLKVVLFLLIVNIIGISTTSFTAILAAAGLAVGMAMKDNLSNFAGGVMLLVNKPFRIGNRILAQTVDGEVQAIGILYTTVLTADNRTVFIPNGPLSTGTISNYSRERTRRIDRTLSIKHGVNIYEAKAILEDICNSDSRILAHPKPFVGVTNITNTTIDMTMRVWVVSDNYSDVNVYLNEVAYSKLLEKGMYRAL